MSKFFNWVIDTLAREDVIDLYFILTDLIDVNITPEEHAANAFYDAMASHTQYGSSGGSNPFTGDDTPIGKTVL